MKPTKKDRKKFDIDLQFGSIREDKIADMLTNKKIEVKSERGKWMETGNICIEYQSYGKPSGIEATEADFWFHNLCIGNEIFCTLVFDVPKLKKLVKKLDYLKSVSGAWNVPSIVASFTFCLRVSCVSYSRATTSVRLQN